MNKLILVGHLCRDPESKFVNDKQVVNFTLAVQRSFKSKDGTREADFVNIVIWGKTAEIAEKFLNKGSQCGLIGRLQIRSYEAKDGTKRYVSEMIAYELELIGNKKDNAPADSPNPDQLNDPDFAMIDSSEDTPF